MTGTARRSVVLVSPCVVNALIWMPTSVIAVALPAIHRDLGSSFTELQWMINAYTLAVAALLIVMGRTSDLLGAAARSSSDAPCSHWAPCSRRSLRAPGG